VLANLIRVLGKVALPLSPGALEGLVWRDFAVGFSVHVEWWKNGDWIAAASLKRVCASWTQENSHGKKKWYQHNKYH
jgi:hypothetical protein